MGLVKRLYCRAECFKIKNEGNDMIKISNIKIKPDQGMEALHKEAAKILHIKEKDIIELKILKKSLDARKKDHLFYLYTIAVKLEKEKEILHKNKNKQLENYVEHPYVFPKVQRVSKKRPVVVGMGPAGLFCGYYLAKAGLKPIMIERGKAVDQRKADVEAFWQTNTLHPDSNVQFGEGGAGTFSDGKLNTLVKDKYGRNKEVLRLFVKFGAPEHILYDSKPHIGTDILCDVVKNMRNEIINLGGEIFFETKLTDIVSENHKLQRVIVNGIKEIDCDCLVLALGHSARDTFEMLYQKELSMEPKPFAIGVRVQHRQEDINYSQYGDTQYELPAAPYKIAEKTRDGRGVYSFCMCPGGYVVNASSEEKRLCINGMSYSKRDGKNANSAIIVTIDPQDYGDGHPLSGVKFQRELERKTYALAKGKIPVQTYKSFKSNTQDKSKLPPDEGMTFAPAMKGEYAFCDITGVFPEYVQNGIVDGMEAAAHKIKSFNKEDTLLSAVESRTSSPLRIVRNEESLQTTIAGVYPCGEGAGYAGGITSAAMDGIKVAEAIAILKSID